MDYLYKLLIQLNGLAHVLRVNVKLRARLDEKEKLMKLHEKVPNQNNFRTNRIPQLMKKDKMHSRTSEI